MMLSFKDMDDKPATLKLTVMSRNVVAVSLHKKMGFQSLNIYGGLDVLSSVMSLHCHSTTLLLW